MQIACILRRIICGLFGCVMFFPHYLISGTIFLVCGGGVGVGVGAVHEQKMCVLIFFYNLGVKRFLILGSVQRDSVLNVRYFCRFLVILIFAN